MFASDAAGESRTNQAQEAARHYDGLGTWLQLDINVLESKRFGQDWQPLHDDASIVTWGGDNSETVAVDRNHSTNT